MKKSRNSVEFMTSNRWCEETHWRLSLQRESNTWMMYLERRLDAQCERSKPNLYAVAEYLRKSANDNDTLKHDHKFWSLISTARAEARTDQWEVVVKQDTHKTRREEVIHRLSWTLPMLVQHLFKFELVNSKTLPLVEDAFAMGTIKIKEC